MMRSIITASGCAWLVAACIGGGPSTQESEPLQGDSSEPLQAENIAAVGATLPYVEQEAENAVTNGTILSSRVWRTLAYEASGRKAVQLVGQGKFVEFTLTAPANAMDFRYSIPDAAGGGGAGASATAYNATISLYVNGNKLGTLPLTSLYSWRYGPYQFANTPSNNPFHFYDDYRTWLGSNLPVGAKVRLQVDAGDTSPWYVIDLADFEQVANPIAQPSGSASVLSFGADPTGVADSAPAFDAAIAANRGRVVWIPPGTYKITRHIIVDNVTLAGAGPWYTILRGLGVGLYGNYTPANGGPGASSNVTLKDFAIFGETTSRVDSDQVNGIGGALSNSTVSNVWIEHTKVAAWMDGPMDRLTFTGCRFKNLYADAVNFHRGVTNSVVTNSIIRNAGDDGLAMWAETTTNANNTFSFNTVQVTQLANGIAIYGGSNNHVTDNIVSDTMRQGGGIHYANRFASVPIGGTNLIARNVLNRAGCVDENWQFGVGALWFDGRDGPMTATINVNDNVINDSIQQAVHFIDSSVTGVTFNNLQINGTGSFAMQFQSTGSATFNNVVATGVALAGQYNCIGPGFAVNQGPGNSGWSTSICGAFPSVPSDPGNPNPNPPAPNARISTPAVNPGPYGAVTGPALAAPANLDFGTLTTGNSATRTVTLSNPGTASTTLNGITSTGAEFAIQSNTCGASLAPGASCAVNISFAPSTTGVRSGALTVASSAPGSPISIALSGTGATLDGNQAAGKPVVASSALGNFPASNAVDGDPLTYWESANGSFPQSLTVDLGTPIPVTRVILKLPPLAAWATRNQPFSVSTSTDNNIFTNRASSAGVFNPAVANNTVTVDFTSVTARYVRIQITGNSGWPAGQISELEVWPGTPAPSSQLTASPTSLSFATQNIGTTSAAQSVTVRNTGSATATLGGIATGSSEFAQTNNCGASLGAGATCTVNVTFTPVASGARSATLTVTSSSPLTVALSGTGAGGGNPGTATNVALGKSITASSTTASFVAANAVDGSVTGTSYWEGAAVSQLTVDLGADTPITSVVVKLNPDPIWAARTQTYAILGRTSAAGSFTTLSASAPRNFAPPVNAVTTSVSATVRFVQLSFTGNTGAPGGQVAELEVLGFQPDLSVTDITLSSANNPPREGDAITFAAVVTNTGSAATGATNYGVSFQVDGAQVATGTSSTSIPPGGNVTVTATTTFAGSSGPHTVLATVDTANAIAESNEANNTFSETFTIQQVPGPDLQILSVTPTPASPTAGQAVSFTVAVNNRGTTSAGANTVTRLVVGATTLNGTAGAIAAGATVNVAITGSWTAVNGNTNVTATTDATNLVVETNESNNTFTRTLFVGRGANVPWDQYEAEVGTFTGTLETGTWAEGTLSGEASGRRAVTLSGSGQSVQWTSRVNANSIVVRYSVPDGSTNSLDVFVNSTAVARIAVSGEFAWLYSGRTNGDLHLAQNTRDAAHPDQHHMYDEGNALLSATGAVTIRPGDVVRVQPVNATPAITVDFIDLELVAAPLAAPANYVTVTGSTQNDIQSAINTAVSGARPGIFLPPGTYQMNNIITLPGGLTVQGAGMWHTKLVTAGGTKNVSWGFQAGGNGSTFQDFAMFGSYDTRVDGTGRAFGGNMQTNTSIRRIWAERWVVGGWITGGSNLLFQDIRFRNTMADGINLANGTQNSRIVNSTVRNAGDDGFAMWSTTDLGQGPDFGNVIQNCTAALIWRAAGFAVYGGHDNVVRDSYVYDTLKYPGLTIDNEFIPQFPFSGTTTFTNMTIERCGGLMWWDEEANPAVSAKRKWGAVWLFAADPNSSNQFTGIRLTNIDIIDPVFYGVMIQTIAGQAIRDTIFDGVNITMNQSGEFGVIANDSHKQGLVGASGAITFRNSSITGSRVTPGNMFSKDAASTGFSYIDGGGNNWTGNR